MGRSKEEEGRWPSPKKSEAAKLLAAMAPALGELKPLRTFPLADLGENVLSGFFMEVARASALASLGFNRSGEMHVTLFLEGSKATRTARTPDEAEIIIGVFQNLLESYRAEKGW